jgi:hypothetical protein
MRDAMTKADLPLDCKPHGLRKTLGRRLADAGCTAHEIMAMLGHTTLEEAERYTRELIDVASEDRPSSNWKHTKRTNSPKPHLGVWGSGQKSVRVQGEGKALALPRGARWNNDFNDLRNSLGCMLPIEPQRLLHARSTGKSSVATLLTNCLSALSPQ